MAKRASGQGSARPPEPDPEQMAVDTLMTSVFTGISFMVAIVVYAVTGGAALFLVADIGRTAAMIAFGLGLAVGFGLLVYVLRTNALRIESRSRNLYRGAWIGLLFGLAIIIVLYYLPWVAIPTYCPPGAVCS